MQSRINMIKRLFLFLLLFGYSVDSFSTHAAGMDLTYESIGGNQYRVTLKFYRDCGSGNAIAPGFFPLDYSSNSCNYSNVSFMNQISFQNVTPVCVTITDPCNEPGVVGIEEYVYQTTITLPNNCTDWVLSVCETRRNGAITTINQGWFINTDLCVQAVINNTNNK